MVHGDCYVTLTVMMSSEEIMTLTFLLNALTGHQKEIMTLAFALNVLIGQLNSHMMESFAYLTKIILVQPSTVTYITAIDSF